MMHGDDIKCDDDDDDDDDGTEPIDNCCMIDIIVRCVLRTSMARLEPRECRGGDEGEGAPAPAPASAAGLPALLTIRRCRARPCSAALRVSS
jgi:hypothetical protein